MKKITLVLILALFTINGNFLGQSKSAHVETSSELKSRFNKDANAFFKLLNDENWEGMTEMMYPKLFEMATKEQMVAALSQMTNSGLKMTVNEVNIYKISNPILVEGEMFRKLSYKAKMKIKLSGEMLESVSNLEENFKGVFGENNVKFDNATSSFLVDSDKALIAIADEGKSNWTYLEFNEAQPQMLKALFPEKVYNDFKSN